MPLASNAVVEGVRLLQIIFIVWNQPSRICIFKNDLLAFDLCFYHLSILVPRLRLTFILLVSREVVVLLRMSKRTASLHHTLMSLGVFALSVVEVAVGRLSPC